MLNKEEMNHLACDYIQLTSDLRTLYDSEKDREKLIRWKELHDFFKELGISPFKVGYEITLERGYNPNFHVLGLFYIVFPKMKNK